ncbi:unnamed protein product [Cyprideis torosa]|uniref:Ribosomal protein eL8/eL30/eS12/Gadd45 domain-containing protein n=1 Tax=Cyprideis torosa TaxID=163714 RepID=A0A7R8W5L7_9CRUS|nr:unnamed protein product [Cyprideis torosa]CAG0883036.1 unnamed protein product [Cyprideis torosa]
MPGVGFPATPLERQHDVRTRGVLRPSFITGSNVPASPLLPSDHQQSSPMSKPLFAQVLKKKPPIQALMKAEAEGKCVMLSPESSSSSMSVDLNHSGLVVHNRGFERVPGSSKEESSYSYKSSKSEGPLLVVGKRYDTPSYEQLQHQRDQRQLRRIPPSKDKQKSTNQQRPKTNQQRPLTNQQRPSSTNQQLPSTSQQRPLTNQQRSSTNQQRPLTNQQRPSTNQQRPPTNLPLTTSQKVNPVDHKLMKKQEDKSTSVHENQWFSKNKRDFGKPKPETKPPKTNEEVAVGHGPSSPSRSVGTLTELPLPQEAPGKSSDSLVSRENSKEAAVSASTQLGENGDSERAQPTDAPGGTAEEEESRKKTKRGKRKKKKAGGADGEEEDGGDGGGTAVDGKRKEGWVTVTRRRKKKTREEGGEKEDNTDWTDMEEEEEKIAVEEPKIIEKKKKVKSEEEKQKIKEKRKLKKMFEREEKIRKASALERGSKNLQIIPASMPLKSQRRRQKKGTAEASGESDQPDSSFTLVANEDQFPSLRTEFPTLRSGITIGSSNLNSVTLWGPSTMKEEKVPGDETISELPPEPSAADEKKKKKAKDPISLDLTLLIKRKKAQGDVKKTMESQLLTSKKKSQLPTKKTVSFVANILDSSAPARRRGKERRVPKAKKPTKFKRAIQAQREEKKADEEKRDRDWRKELDDPVKRSIHTKKFREYCDHFLHSEIDSLVDSVVRDLIRFQDRLHAKDPIKAHAKRRWLCGLKEVLKMAQLKRLKAVIIAPDLEILAELNKTVAAILDEVSPQGTPVIYAMNRRQLGYLSLKKRPVSCIGILDYGGAEVDFKKLLARVEEEREKYQSHLEAARKLLDGNEKVELPKNCSGSDHQGSTTHVTSSLSPSAPPWTPSNKRHDWTGNDAAPIAYQLGFQQATFLTHPSVFQQALESELRSIVN